MNFISTRGNQRVGSASEAIVQGLAKDGGLFVPQSFPNLFDKLSDMVTMSYGERAALVIHGFLDEYNYEDLKNACEEIYSSFEDGDAAPLVKVDENFYILELFHGPTLAFKDIALTLLPYLLRKGADNIGQNNEILILVATSGDTGKAALEGFKDKEGVKIMVFYPSDGVSDMQKAQMRTQEGKNVKVVGVNGNFDDCQTAVKKIFSDKEFEKILKEQGVVLSSANSINFGRLVPQISYYFSAYCDLVQCGDIKIGDKVDFVVPTGNFGNILAGYYAKQMGLPVGKLVCASNSNKALTDFFESGSYDIKRDFIKTISPSMDILISSNLERLIFEMSGRNAKLTAERMFELQSKGNYAVSDKEKEILNNEFYGASCSEKDCLDTIRNIFEDYGYLSDTHTAVALKIAKEFMANNYKNPVVVLSTASPYKFTQSVLKALCGSSPEDGFVAAEKLQDFSAMPIPKQISSLKNRSVRFNNIVEPLQAREEVLGFINE